MALAPISVLKPVSTAETGLRFLWHTFGDGLGISIGISLSQNDWATLKAEHPVMLSEAEA